ncbi:MAG: rhodanese-like domain-containing protein [Actinomycetota bacterium]|nr:rhodanese-like domain-containing protein [Actinomycetota bacterium]
MKFDQYYLDCLSHASYLIGDESSKKAVVVDPQRDISGYLATADEAGLDIVMVIETHFHADFLSGHLELAAATGAEICYSSVADPEFAHRKIEHGERVSLGEVALEFRHTPGHTPESMSIVVYENADSAPYGVLTGDTLFIGDVGRPDLLASIGFTREELAEKLYDSLHQQLMTLPDDTIVFPAHGAGSACGKNLSTELTSTIGEQRYTNYAIRASSQEAFMAMVTEGQPPAPSYFVYDAVLNRKERDLLDESALPPSMDYAQIQGTLANGAMLVDGRDPEEFSRGHLKGAINVGMAGRYAEFAGSIVPSDVDIVLFTDPGQELEAKNRLARIGFDRVIGIAAQPYHMLTSHAESTQVASRLTADEFNARVRDLPDLQIVDVRNPGEVTSGTAHDAQTIPVGQLPARLDELDAAKPTVVFCAGGYRSSVAASLLRQKGFGDVSDVIGGYTAWIETTQSA